MNAQKYAILLFLCTYSLSLYAQDLEADTQSAINEVPPNEAFSEPDPITQAETQLLFEPSEDTEEISIQPFGIWNTIKVFLILVGLLILGMGILLFFRKLQGTAPEQNSNVIDIVSSKVLFQGSALHLVKLARKYLLISQTSQVIQLISEFNEKDDIDEIVVALSIAESEEDEHKPASKKLSFHQRLLNGMKQLMSKGSIAHTLHARDNFNRGENSVHQGSDLLSYFRNGRGKR